MTLVVNPSADSFVTTTILSFPSTEKRSSNQKFSVVIQCRIRDREGREWMERKNLVLQVLVKPSV